MSKVLIAFMAGLGLGLLLAPETGADLRNKLGDWLSDRADDALDAAKRGVDRAQDAAGNLESRIRKAIN